MATFTEKILYGKLIFFSAAETEQTLTFRLISSPPYCGFTMVETLYESFRMSLLIGVDCNKDLTTNSQLFRHLHAVLNPIKPAGSILLVVNLNLSYF